MKTDCLVIGFNDSSFEDYVKMVRSMGADSGAYKDLSLAFIDYEGKPRTSMEMLNHFYFEGRERPHELWHNSDFLWPVITYMGTYLTSRGFNFDYVNLFHLEKDKLREKLQHDDILTIAITTTLYVSPHPILEIISFIKRYNQTAKIIVGGPYVGNQIKMSDMASNQRLFDFIGADIYVNSNEGEATLVNILNALRSGSTLDAVDNISYKNGERYATTAISIESNPLEENMVDYSLFPRKAYGEFVTLRTAKSCPFSCSFCGFPQRAGKYKYLSVELVEKELDAIRDIGNITTLTFIDDTFNVPKERFKEMLRMMIRNNYGFKWNSFYRSDHGDPEAIELMGKAGCEGVFLGIESGSDQMLLRMNKTARRKDYLSAIPLLRAAGISTHANVIVGFPGETYDSVQETVSLLEEAKPDFYRAQLWYADPVTPIWQKREEYGIEGSAFHWKHNTMDYETACDLVDKMFLCVENSTWLPQNGFEQWSVFYLQRKGMSLSQISKFLRSFNALIKEKLISPNKQEPSPGLLERLRKDCQFDRDRVSESPAIDAYSGRRYMEAQRYWIDEFSSAAPVPNTEALRLRSVEPDGQGIVTRKIDNSVLVRAAKRCQSDLSGVVLGAYTALLSRLNGRQEIVIVSGGDGETEALPLRLYPRWDMPFKDHVREIKRKAGEAGQHALYAFHILTNRLRMAEHGLECPVFDVGYGYTDLQSQPALQDVLGNYPAIEKGMGLILNVTSDAGQTILDFSYAKSWFKEETIVGLSVYLQSIVEEAAHTPEILIGEIVLDSEEMNQCAAISADASEVFNF